MLLALCFHFACVLFAFRLRLACFSLRVACILIKCCLLPSFICIVFCFGADCVSLVLCWHFACELIVFVVLHSFCEFDSMLVCFLLACCLQKHTRASQSKQHRLKPLKHPARRNANARCMQPKRHRKFKHRTSNQINCF